jgi:hypothetical protein
MIPTIDSANAARTSAPSAQRPAGIASAAIGSAYASNTQAVADGETARSAPMPGSVTAAMVISDVTTSIASPSAATGAHFVRRGVIASVTMVVLPLVPGASMRR